MKKEWYTFLTAMMFLTRLPVSLKNKYRASYLQQASKYFPLIGLIVAAISAAVFFLLHLFLSGVLALVGSMIASILTTGAFHEDGFADTCDGFGGGWTKEKILAIMKDSRLGTYGVLGLLLILATKFLLLIELIQHTTSLPMAANRCLDSWKILLGIFLLAHTFSRYLSVTVIQQYHYVTDAIGSKSKPLAEKKLSFTALLMATIFAVLPFQLLPLIFLWILIPAILASVCLAAYFNKWINGYTGDCLGAIQQVTEIVIYLSSLIIWKYF
jgi:adenosylcobinamide-GDP ribazoletransferase